MSDLVTPKDRFLGLRLIQNMSGAGVMKKEHTMEDYLIFMKEKGVEFNGFQNFNNGYRIKDLIILISYYKK